MYKGLGVFCVLFIWLYFGVWCWGGGLFLILSVIVFSWVWGILLLYWILFFEKALGGGKNMIKIYLNFKNVLNN